MPGEYRKYNGIYVSEESGWMDLYEPLFEISLHWVI